MKTEKLFMNPTTTSLNQNKIGDLNELFLTNRKISKIKKSNGNVNIKLLKNQIMHQKDGILSCLISKFVISILKNI